MAVDFGNVFLDALGYQGVSTVDMQVVGIKNTKVTAEVKGYSRFLRSTTDLKNTAVDSMKHSFNIKPGETEIQLQTQIRDFVGRIVHLYGAYDDSFACASALTYAEYRRINRPVVIE